MPSASTHPLVVRTTSVIVSDAPKGIIWSD